MKKVVIVGLGALGSHVVQFARNWKVDLDIVDFDKIESKNAQAQFHPATASGKGKAVSVTNTMRFLWKRKLGTLPVKLVEDNARQLLSGATLVIDCVDNIEARQLISKYAQGDILHGCMSNDGLTAQAIWEDHFSPDTEDEGLATCEDGENLPLHGMYGALIAWVGQRYLKDGVKESYLVTPSSTVRVA